MCPQESNALFFVCVHKLPTIPPSFLKPLLLSTIISNKFTIPIPTYQPPPSHTPHSQMRLLKQWKQSFLSPKHSCFFPPSLPYIHTLPPPPSLKFHVAQTIHMQVTLSLKTRVPLVQDIMFIPHLRTSIYHHLASQVGKISSWLN